MKEMKSIAGCVVASALLAGCAGKPEPAPAPVREPIVRSAPPPVPAPPPPEPSQQDSPEAPLARGDWTYSGGGGASVARFGPAGAESFSLRCEPGRRRIVLRRAGSNSALRVRTTFGQRALAPGGELPADDPLLDEMAYSRGRFTVETEGLEPLIVPTWPEPVRVVEDCRF
ncbi:MAG TPA: hypothetical protein VE891_01615 [Allosphingosinicella sp.]|nr:hypothetical protein [Allosphingosinicella sp.]